MVESTGAGGAAISSSGGHTGAGGTGTGGKATGGSGMGGAAGTSTGGMGMGGMGTGGRATGGAGMGGAAGMGAGGAGMGGMGTGGKATGGSGMGGSGMGGSGMGGSGMGGMGAGGKATGGSGMGGASMGGSGMGGASMGGSGMGGSGMGGSGMGGSGMGGSGMGGASMGGSGMGGSGVGGSTGGLDCNAALQPNTGGLVTSFADWNVATGHWGPTTGGLRGSKFAFGGGPADASIPTETATVDTTAQNLRLQLGVVAGGYAGGGVSFDSCVTASMYTQLQFTISGSTGGCPYQVQLQTFGQRPATLNPPGGCTANCSQYPAATGLTSPTTTSMPITVPFSSFTGLTAAMETELVGIQWQVNSGSGACTVDIRIDDIKFLP
jgi:hypothetical protein